MNLNLTPAHIHLILNHIPIVGVAFVAVQLLIALIYRNHLMQKVSLVFLVVIALTTAIVYQTGDGTTAAVKNLPGVSAALIDAHSSAAHFGLAVMFVIGCVALGGLLLFMRRDKLPRLFVVAVFVLTLVATGIMIWIGYLGGQIMHSEIRQQSLIVAPLALSWISCL